MMIGVETVQISAPFSAHLTKCEGRYVSTPLTAILVAVLMTATIPAAQAAKKKIQVPDQYDGSWSITAVTKDGPCAASTSYQVQIKDSDASVPGDDIDIDGGVAASGAVQATIKQGANLVPITGSLSQIGSGSGTWHTSGGVVECSGSWSAKRSS
ncbi:heme utilization protein [Methylobacterium brachiatum]